MMIYNKKNNHNALDIFNRAQVSTLFHRLLDDINKYDYHAYQSLGHMMDITHVKSKTLIGWDTFVRMAICTSQIRAIDKLIYEDLHTSHYNVFRCNLTRIQYDELAFMQFRTVAQTVASKRLHIPLGKLKVKHFKGTKS